MIFFKKLSANGDTIVEVLMVMVVLGTVLAGAYATSSRNLKTNRQAQERGEALKLVEQQLELAKSLAPKISSSSTNIFTINSSFCIKPDAAHESDIIIASPVTKPDCQDQGAGKLYDLSIQQVDSITGNPSYSSKLFRFTATWESLSGNGRDNVSLSYKLYP